MTGGASAVLMSTAQMHCCTYQHRFQHINSTIQKTGTEPFLLQSVKKRKLSYYGHVLWKEGNCMEKEIMQGTTSGQRRWRPRTRWQNNITKWTGLTGDRLRRSVEDRSQWRKLIHEAANPRIEDGRRYTVQGTDKVLFLGTSVPL